MLGVDIYKNGKVILDVNEKRILEEVKDWRNTWIILSPIGHQGILLGRGNQQISPEIIKQVGKHRIIVAATKSKLQNIERTVLRVDTSAAEVGKMLRGSSRLLQIIGVAAHASAVKIRQEIFKPLPSCRRAKSKHESSPAKREAGM